MSKHHLYSVWKIPPNPNPRARYKDQYHITKHHRATLIEEEHYTVKAYPKNNWYKCECPGFVNWGYCRHQKIVEIFVTKNKVGSGALYDFDNERFSNEFISSSEDHLWT